MTTTRLPEDSESSPIPWGRLLPLLLQEGEPASTDTFLSGITSTLNAAARGDITQGEADVILYHLAAAALTHELGYLLASGQAERCFDPFASTARRRDKGRYVSFLRRGLVHAH